MCRFGDGAIKLSGFSGGSYAIGADVLGAAFCFASQAQLWRMRCLFRGVTAVTHCLLLLRQRLRGGKFNCVRLLRFLLFTLRRCSPVESGLASAGSLCLRLVGVTFYRDVWVFLAEFSVGPFLADFWTASSKLHAAVEDDWSSRNCSRLRHEADT